LAINILMLVFYVTDSGSPQFSSDAAQLAVLVLAIIHLTFSVLMVVAFVWTAAPIIVYVKDKEWESKKRQKELINLRLGNAILTESAKKVQQATTGVLLKIYFIFSDGFVLYHLLYLFFSALGVAYPPFFAFHTLDLALRHPTVRNVLKSVTVNGGSIILTGILVVIIVYIYSMIAFFAFRDDYTASGVSCDTLFQCWVTTIDFGIQGGGIGSVLQSPDILSSKFPPRFFFDLTFFIIIIIILLNIVFGIILDTFGELRDKKKEIDTDIKSRCFVCSIESDVFQRQALGFAHHIKHEHNMWHYLYFLVHLELKPQDEYTSAEYYVNEMIESSSIDWLPNGKSICIPEDQ